MPEMIRDESCREKILSEDYIDLIIPDYRSDLDVVVSENEACIQNLGFGYRAIHVDKNLVGEVQFAKVGYNAVPNCYALLDTGAMNETGISALQNYPTLQLQGNGIMIGFIDTGIDYMNPVFRTFEGTRLAAIWDQTIQTGTPPEGFSYGSEYTREQINEAIRSSQPESVVPSMDRNGHGTYVASLAAGSSDVTNQFQGAAPKAMLGVVKLKEAKNFLKDFYAIKEDAVCYQDTDIMQGLLYLDRLASRMNLPLVICVALGTNFGGHNGESNLSRILQSYARQDRRCVVIGGGNEASQRHHYFGTLTDGETQEVEIRVEEGGGRGFVAEVWTALPNIITAYLVSPTGERSPEISIRQGDVYDFQFAFDNTIVRIEYRLLLNNSSSLLVFLRFSEPSVGVWRLGVSSLQMGDGEYHIWLSMNEFLEHNTYFLEANPNTTITEPANTNGAITTAFYNGTDNSVDINSGRGYTRSNLVKPDFATPGVQITGAGLNGRFVKRSGSSGAAGIASGAAALIMEWLINRPESLSVSTGQVASIMILGAEQETLPAFPNREWGYGTLDVYQSLDRLRRL